METTNDKYFVATNGFGFSVVYQDYSDEAGNFWAIEKDGFATDVEACEYANQLNKEK